MNTGKTLFAQIMDFLPWSTFDRILPGEFGSANRTAVISSRYRSLHMSHVPVFARARYLCKNSQSRTINPRRELDARLGHGSRAGYVCCHHLGSFLYRPT
jgi:hypothetical protein